jgi:hypothetical protein
MRKLCGLLPLLGLYFGLGATAQAAEITRVASSFDKDNKFDLHFGVGYDFNFKKAALLREWSDANNPQSQVVRDLLYQQMRHVVTPSLEIGLYKDLAVYANIPIVALDTRTYSFDQGASDCVYDDGMRNPDNPATCVDQSSGGRANNSTTIRDGILPQGGFDATKPDQPYGNFNGTDNQTIFKGANRQGVDQVNVGLKYAVLNQDRLSHMPKWVIGLEGRFAVGKPMTFSRDITTSDPKGNHTVGRGMHELGVWTALSRRYRFLDPFFNAWWYAAMPSGNSQFKNLGGAQDRVNPQSQVGVTFGTEIVPFERKAKGQKVSIQLRGLAMLKFNGRGYSEGWELFADSPALVGNNKPGTDKCTAADIRDINDAAKQDPTNPNYIPAGSGCSKFNGITNIQDFATFGLNLGLNFQLNKYAVLMLGVNGSTDTRHWISAAGRGKASLGGDPNLVEPNTNEVNPVRRDVIDNVGRRYAVGDVTNVTGYFRFLLTF